MHARALPTLVLLVLADVHALTAQNVRPPEVRYHLTAHLNDETGSVTGVARISYRQFTPNPVDALTLSLGHNYIADVVIDGQPVTVQSEQASVARLILPRPLAPGDSLAISLRWQSWPAALRQRARRVELVRWYPLLLDEVSGTPVLSPSISSHLLELDLAADQIIGGTGVPVCGDPGWTRAALPTTTVTLRPNSYASTPGAACDDPAPDRKKVVWYAEGVTEMAFAVSPTFRYEEGNIFEKPVRALYERGGERSWGAGLATRRTEAALAWTNEIGGHFPWPHITVIEGIADGGEALPMVLLTNESSQSALLHLVGLMISQQMLVGGSRVITQGSAAFQTTWFFEKLGRRGDYARIEREILDWDLDGLARVDEPLLRSVASAPCASTSCRRTEFLQHQLRWWADNDETVRDIYRTVIDRYLLKPTVPGAFMAVSREKVEPDPTPLYAQLPSGGTLYDDAIGRMRREPLPDGRWSTTVVLDRRAPGRFPQTVWVIGESDTVAARATALTAQETLTIVTRSQPRLVVIDPLAESHDWNMLNNRRSFSRGVLGRSRPKDKYVDTYFGRRTVRDRLTEGYAPTVWRNDAGDWTYGLRVRQDYLGRFELNEGWAALSTSEQHADFHWLLRLRNPVWLRRTGWSQGIEIARLEGRAAARVDIGYRLPRRVSSGTVRELGLGLQWLTVTDSSYLDARSYDDVGTAELIASGKIASRAVHSPHSFELSVTGGHAYGNSGTLRNGGYGRVTAAAAARKHVHDAVTIGGRLFAGAVSGDPPRQRRIFIAGTDPYQQFDSPFLRSRGALLVRPGFFYHDPGGAGVRVAAPHVASTRALGATLEIEYSVLRSPTPITTRGAFAAFVDGAVGNGDLDPDRNRMMGIGAAGVGLRFDHRIGSTTFQTRMDVPLWRSRPELRGWTFSFTPSF